MLQVFASVTAPAGLVGWWRAENNAQDSAGTNHGVLRNGAGFAAGRVGQAFALDGTDDCIEIPDAPALRPVSVTLEAWVAFDVISGLQVLLTKPQGQSESYALQLEFGTLKGAVRFRPSLVTIVSTLITRPNASMAGDPLDPGEMGAVI